MDLSWREEYWNNLVDRHGLNELRHMRTLLQEQLGDKPQDQCSTLEAESREEIQQRITLVDNAICYILLVGKPPSWEKLKDGENEEYKERSQQPEHRQAYQYAKEAYPLLEEAKNLKDLCTKVIGDESKWRTVRIAWKRAEFHQPLKQSRSNNPELKRENFEKTCQRIRDYYELGIIPKPEI